MTDDERVLSVPGRLRGTVDTSVAHIARVYDYWLGGKDNFAVDRELGDLVREIYPDVVHTVRANRAFLKRAVRSLAGEAGIRQFLDIGTGIPAAENTHEIAQRLAPSSRTVYVDNDPMVLAHARALLTCDLPCATAYVDADLRDVEKILAHASELLDFTRPVAVMLVAILHCIPDEADPCGIVGRLMDSVPAGSYLVVSHPPGGVLLERGTEALQLFDDLMKQTVTLRSRTEVGRFFDGLEMLEPGVVPVSKWRPACEAAEESAPPAGMWAAVGRKVRQ